MDELTQRFERVARGRRVSVLVVSNSLLRRDFTVRFQPDGDGYVVELTADGQFEGAYRFLERWIDRDASTRDGVYETPPVDHIDFVQEPQYWMVERYSDQLLTDLEKAVLRFCEYMENEMYFMPQPGDVLIEQRVKALRGLLNHFDETRGDIRRAILSPHTVSVLQSADILPASNTR